MKEINITLEVGEMMYDIQNKTYLTGRSREAENAKTFEAASHMQASDDDENSYQIRRSITNRYNELRTLLSEYVVDGATTADNLIIEAVDNDARLLLTLAMPANYNPAATAAIGTAMHDYIVSLSIADWFAITNKADAADYTARAAKILEDLRRALSRRLRPSRPEYVTTRSVPPIG